jgi:hypothetical protein
MIHAMLLINGEMWNWMVKELEAFARWLYEGV